jgi:GNAT superfamily N-acetyltransferase
MATAPHDARPELIGLASLSPVVVRQLFERERRTWLERLLWDTRDAADLAASAVGSHVIDGAALRRGTRWQGFVAVQPGRPLARLCGGWLENDVTAGDASLLVGEALRRLTRSSRVEGQLVAFGEQDVFDAGFREHGFATEPRDYLIAELTDSQPRHADVARLMPVDSLLVSDCARVLVSAHRGGVEARINASFRTERGANEYLGDILAGQGCGEVAPEACIAAVHDGRVRGFCLATIISEGVGHVPQIAVEPSAQGEGLGHALLSASFRALRRRNAGRVTLSVSSANVRAARWYSRLGFQPATRFTAYHRDTH